MAESEFLTELEEGFKPPKSEKPRVFPARVALAYREERVSKWVDTIIGGQDGKDTASWYGPVMFDGYIIQTDWDECRGGFGYEGDIICSAGDVIVVDCLSRTYYSIVETLKVQ